MLSHEDYKDVKSKMGGGMANKVKRVTNDSIKTSKSKALGKMYTSPTGSQHRIGSAKHKYWQDIEKRQKDKDKYGD